MAVITASIFFTPCSKSENGQWNFSASAQWRHFLYDSNWSDSNNASTATLEAEHFTQWNDGNDSFIIEAFLRYEADDPEQRRLDFKELVWVGVRPHYEFRAGVRTVFWGVTETQHLVDIINQTDWSFDLDNEEKLGQTMLNISWAGDMDILDIYLLMGFRERPFPGGNGRLRGPFLVDQNAAEYSSGAADNRVDGAVRWQRTIGQLDAALSYFTGTSRIPELVPFSENESLLKLEEIELKPIYHTIDQLGLELQYIVNDTAFKLEAVSNSGFRGRYVAATAGFEYTQVGAFGSMWDIGWLAEYSTVDESTNVPGQILQEDMAVAIRLNLNNVYDTSALIGAIQNGSNDGRMVFVEAASRIGDAWRVNFDVRIFESNDNVSSSQAGIVQASMTGEQYDRYAFLDNDDYVQLELTYYF